LEVWAIDKKHDLVLPNTEAAAAWKKTIEAQIFAELNAVSSKKEQEAGNAGVGEDGEPVISPEKIWNEIKAVSPGNCKCADCGADEPDWVSINLGVLICLQCSGVHRSLGVHISKVRSLTLDVLDPFAQIFVKAVGNTAANEIYEKTLDPDLKVIPSDSRADKNDFIRSKYDTKKFIADDGLTPEERTAKLFTAAQTGDVILAINCLIRGANFLQKAEENGRTPLHVACEQGKIVVVIAIVQHALCQRDGTGIFTEKDNDGNTPLLLAQAAEQTECSDYLIISTPKSLLAQ